MPLMWVSSVFVGSFLLVVLLFMYNYMKSFCYYELGGEVNDGFSIKW